MIKFIFKKLKFILDVLIMESEFLIGVENGHFHPRKEGDQP
jgi:hypothetical protein